MASMINRPFSRWPTWWHMVLVCVSCLMGLLSTLAMLAEQRGQTQRVQLAMAQARSQLVADDAPKAGDHPPYSGTEPAQWPLRTDTGNVVRQASEAAQTHGVTLRTLSVSHQAESAQTSGRVTLDLSASGSYSALKAWQAAMQERFSALSLQSLRMQGNSSNAGGLDAQLLWVLHVRD